MSLARTPYTVGIALLACASFCLAACHGKHSCRADSQCPVGEVCFADGCGDPARGIRIEASPSTAGRVARDIAIDEVHGRQDLELSYPPTLQGSISVVASDPPRSVPYSEDAVAIRGRGESEIIPGLTRTFEITLPTNDPNPEGSLKPDGTFTIAISAGVYSISLSTLDPHLPPATTRATTALRSGAISTLDLSLGPLRPPVPLTFEMIDPRSPLPDLEAQAFSDPVNLQPLSQRTPVLGGRQCVPTPCGGELQLSPSVRLNPTFVVQVFPRDPAALVPQKTFGPFPSNPTPPTLQLAMGDYGDPVFVTGTIVDVRGGAISGVTVYVDGPVGGGGTFRSQRVQTADDGTFSLTTLRSASGSNSTLWAIPPAQSMSGILRLPLPIRGATALGSIRCPDKVVAQGSVYKSDESPAPGVRVFAFPIQPLNGRPLPGNGDQSVTDEQGQFSLKLDPAVYRLDFIPGGQLPRTSRFAAVGPEPRLVQLPDVFLSKGRKITGIVYAVASQQADNAGVAPFTALRFFRLTNDLDGRPGSSVLLGETVSDATGNYAISLPTR